MPSLFDSLVFAPPASTYTSATFGTRLRFLSGVPCLLMPVKESTAVILYFHGNAEDLGHSAIVCKMLQRFFNAHVVAVEYPGYGVYEGKPNEAQIMEDAEKVVEHLRRELQWPLHDMFLLGRSLGTGPATFLASKHSVGGLALVSPYISIRAVVTHVGKSTMIGLGGMASYLFKDQFPNLKHIRTVRATTPVVLFHGTPGL